MHRVLISGYYGFGNTGDEAILHVMVTEIRRSNPDTLIYVLSNDPETTSKTYDVVAIERYSIPAIIKAIKNCDTVISGGGSLFQDVTSLKVPFYYALIFLISYFFRKPVYTYAQGIGPVNSRFNRNLIRYVMNQCSYISVRDENSQRELRNMGVKHEIECTLDPAFLIEPVNVYQVEEILEAEKGEPLSGKPLVAFAIRRWKGDVDMVSEIAGAADLIYEKLGVEIVFLSLYRKEDLPLADKIAEKMKHPSIIIRKHYGPEIIAGIFGKMKMNICVRFHALVFSALNGVPMAAISYDPKIDSFMDFLGINTVIDYGNVNQEKLFDMINKKWQNCDPEKEYIQVKAEKSIKTAREGIENLINKMGL